MHAIEIHHTVKGRPDIEPIIERYVIAPSPGRSPQHPLYATVACPRCRAAVGVPCTMGRGSGDRLAHLPRADRAVALTRGY
ncbi:zinc finger domain-containing protein [Rhodococcus sp. IEGM 1401]|uniref:zinc finger domain-containing protein n=1 Tax=Rhodococcus sp. IEGM 1401 TaxID=3014755 RepID=UPI003FA7CAB9